MKNVIDLVRNHYTHLSTRQPFLQWAAMLVTFIEFMYSNPETRPILRELERKKIAAHRPLQVALRKLRSEIEKDKYQLIFLLDSIPVTKQQEIYQLLILESKAIFGVSKIKDIFFEPEKIVIDLYSSIRTPLKKLLALDKKNIVIRFAKIIEFGKNPDCEIEFSYPSGSVVNQHLGVLKGKRKFEIWGYWDTIRRFYEEIKNGVSLTNTSLISNLANIANYEKVHDCIDRFCLYLLQQLHLNQKASSNESETSKLFLVSESADNPSIINNVTNTVTGVNSQKTHSFSNVHTEVNAKNPNKQSSGSLEKSTKKEKVDNSKLNDLEEDKNEASLSQSSSTFVKKKKPMQNLATNFYFDTVEFFYDNMNGNLWIILHRPTDFEKYFMGHFKGGKADVLAQELMSKKPKTKVDIKKLSHTCGELKLTKEIKKVFFSKAPKQTLANIWNGAIVHLSSIEHGAHPFSPQQIIEQLHTIHHSHHVLIPEFPIAIYSKESKAMMPNT